MCPLGPSSSVICVLVEIGHTWWTSLPLYLFFTLFPMKLMNGPQQWAPLPRVFWMGFAKESPCQRQTDDQGVNSFGSVITSSKLLFTSFLWIATPCSFPFCPGGHVTSAATNLGLLKLVRFLFWVSGPIALHSISSEYLNLRTICFLLEPKPRNQRGIPRENTPKSLPLTVLVTNYQKGSHNFTEYVLTVLITQTLL